ncbi:MAG: 2Fe-2S iron-sulfur cluster-binding protein [Gloeobacterales cyanobacterium]
MTYTAQIQHGGQEFTITIGPNETVLVAALRQGVPLSSSCEAGVCTTCASLIQSGIVDQSEGMGIGLELQEKGYALLCVSYPKSDLVIESDKEDEVYRQQFG